MSNSTRQKNTSSGNNSPPLNIVAVGASAGGLKALQAFVTHLPALPHTCLVIAQHLPADRKSELVRLLKRTEHFTVVTAKHQQPLVAGQIYVTPPGNQIYLSGEQIHLEASSGTRGKSPLIDTLFDNLAQARAGMRVGIILSGTGRDGARGGQSLKDIGGFLLAQEPSTASYEEMPRALIGTKVVDAVLPPEQMGQKLLELLRKHNATAANLPTPVSEKERIRNLELELTHTRQNLQRYIHQLEARNEELLSRNSQLQEANQAMEPQVEDPGKSTSRLQSLLNSLRERNKEQSCLYKIARLGHTETTVSEVLQKAVALIPQGWQYPDHTQVCVSWDGAIFGHSEAQNAADQLLENRETHQGGVLQIWVAYLTRPVALAGAAKLFLAEEEKLLASIADNLALIINQINTRQALHDSESRFRSLVESTEDIVFTLDKEQRHTEVYGGSQLSQEMVQNQFLGRTAREIFGEDAQVHEEANARALCGEPVVYEWNYEDERGRKHYLQTSLAPLRGADGEIEGVVGVGRDISDLKRSRRRYKYLFENNPAPMFIWDFSTHLIVDCNRAALNLYGYTREEFIGLNIDQIRPAEDLGRFKEVTASEERYSNYAPKMHHDTWRHYSKDGHLIEVEIGAHLIDYNDRKASLVIVNDVTAQKRAERAVKESEEKYRLLFDTSPLPIWIYRLRDYQILDANQRAAKCFGYSRTQLLLLAQLDLCSEEEAAPFEAAHREMAQSDDLIHLGVRKLRKKNDDPLLMDLTGQKIRFREEDCLMVVGLDVSDAHRLHQQEQLEHQLMEESIQLDSDLPQSLSKYLEQTEQLFPGMRSSILQIRDGCVYNLASPSLPRAYVEAIEGEPIGPMAGSCGTAAHRKKRVIVSDIQKDPLWSAYREVARKHGLAACWSQPIFDSQGRVIATLANYYPHPRKPGKKELELFSRNSSLLSLVMENHHKRQELLSANELFRYVNQATNEAIYDWDIQANHLHWGQGFTRLFGHKADASPIKLQDWSALIHPEDLKGTMDSLQRFLDEGKEERWYAEYRFRKANGHYAHVEEKGYAIRNAEGQAVRMIGVLGDITARKTEEQRLRLMDSVIANANDAVLITEAEPLDAPGPRIIYVNEAFTRITGYEAGEVIGQSPRMLQGPKTDRKELDRLKEALRRWEPCEITVVNYKKNGEEFWINFSVSPVADESGWYTHWISIERDVTENKNQEQLNRLQAEISEGFNLSGTLKNTLGSVLQKLTALGSFDLGELWQVSEDRQKLNLMTASGTDKRLRKQARATAYNSFGYGEGLPGQAWKKRRSLLWKNIHKRKGFLRREEPGYCDLRTGLAIPLLAHDEVLGVLLLIGKKQPEPYLNARQILEKLAPHLAIELKRRLLEEQLLRIFHAAPDIICVAGLDGYFKKVNPAMADLLGYSEKEILTRPITDFVHPDDLQRTEAELEALREGSGRITFENRYLTRDGRTIWLSWSTRLFLEEGVVYSVAKNITEKKELESLLESATNLARIGSWEIDREQDRIYWSRITREIHEVPEDYQPELDEAIDFYPEDYRALVRQSIKDAVEFEKSWSFELPIITARGNQRWVRVIGQPEFINGRCVRIYGSFQDIHQRKEVEERLRHTADNIPGAIFQYTLHADGSDSINNLTKGAEILWGISAEKCMADIQLIWEQTRAGGDYEKVAASIERSMHTMEPWHCQYRSRMPDGRIVWHQGFGTPNRLPDGSTRWDSLIMDITEKKETELLLEQASNLARIGSWELDLRQPGNDSMYWSPVTRQILEVDAGYNPSLTAGFEFYEAESEVRIRQAVDELIEHGRTFDEELLLVTAKGHPRWIRCIGQAERSNGQTLRIFGSFQDIHQRKMAEQELAQKTNYLSSMTQIIGLLLQSEDWHRSLSDCLQIAGETAGADRMYYFEVHRHSESDELLFSQRFEWHDQATTAHIQNPELQQVPARELKELFTPLQKGQPFEAVVNQLPAGRLKTLLNRQDVQSLLVIPVQVEDYFYGFLGFDDCHKPRKWSRDETEFLQSMATNLSAAILRRNNQRELEQAYEERNTILESIGDGFFAVNRDWIVTYWNHKAEKLLGLPKESILGENLWDHFPEAQDMAFYSEYHKVMKTSRPAHFREYFDPLETWFEVSAYPSSQGLSVYFKNINERVKAEEQLRQSNERFEKVTEATHDAIWDWDIANDSLYLGGGFKKLFGYETQNVDITLQSWMDHIHPDDVEPVLHSLQKIIEDYGTVNWQQEYRYLTRDGALRYVIDRGTVIRNDQGEAVRMVGAMSDITHRKEYETSLQKLNATLERHTRELATSNAELEQFAYVASHDLQEPLRMVSSFLTRLENKYADLLDEKAQQYIHFAVDGASRMRQIILDLLEYSRVGKHAGKRTDVSLHELVEEVCLLQQKRIEESGAKVIYKDLPVVRSYRSPLAQVMQNLIANALKYRRESVTPKIRITAEKRKEDWCIAISDNGIGIEKDYFQKIFIIFQRLHAQQEYSGTGMGLAIVKKIVENLDGEIWVESTPGKGSTFYFTLPRH